MSAYINTTSYKYIPFRYTIINPHLSNPPVLFVGGTFQNIETVTRTERVWLEEYKSIVIELPGFGPLDILPRTYNFNFLANCIKHIIDVCQIDRCFAYGYSYGAGPTYRCVQQNQDRFRGLLLGGASAVFNDEMTSKMKRLIKAAKKKDTDFPKRFLSTFYSEKIENIENGRIARLMLARMLRALTHKDLDAFAVNYTRLLREQALPEKPMDVPVHAFIGEHDAFIAYERLLLFRKLCANLVISTLDTCDHFYHLQRPDAVKMLIDRLVTGEDSRDRRHAS